MKITTLEQYHETYERSVKDPEGFWSEIANTFEWKKPWDKTLEWDFHDYQAKWFQGGKLNITENCIDRHLEERGDQDAFIWIPNEVEDEPVHISYKELHEQVCKTANMLKAHGVGKGDRVCLYMPMIPELAYSVLACARIGAIHSVVFAGFSAHALASRINDADAKMVITADGSFRGAKTISLKSVVDDALEDCPTVEACLVYQRIQSDVSMKEGRDYWWHEQIEGQSAECPAEEMDAEDMLFILYTSGSTGTPKGVVHTCGGYMVYTYYSFLNVFQYNDNDIYWCTADIGWITGHSYIVYGPLLAGATSVMTEGVPTYPDAGRFWKDVERLKVNIFYTAPTAIRALLAKGKEFVEPYDLSSLKVLGTVGEPINAEAWHWYNDNVGKGNCPIVDTWWQTETGGIMISPLANITKTKPTYATLPLPGIQPELLDNEANILSGGGVEGNLCIKFPWPSILRTTYGDHERCKRTYFSHFKGYYFSGVGCRRDEDGYYRILGRVDDVINVSGHRMGTAEVENALDQHTGVTEAAVVGYPHEIKGQGIFAFVIADEETLAKVGENGLKKELIDIVCDEIGKIAKPDKILVVSGLPKTRSGKIMRRILRKIAEGDTSNLGDTSTLLDPSVVEAIKRGALELA